MTDDPAQPDLWTYRARPYWDGDHEAGVVDGDTLDVLLDLGFGTYRKERLRLAGLDTAEIHTVGEDTQEFQDGIEQTRFTRDWIVEAMEVAPGDWPLLISTAKDHAGKYGRIVAEVQSYDSGARSLNADLVQQFPEVEDV